MHIFHKQLRIVALLIFITIQSTAQVSFTLPAHNLPSPLTAAEYYFDADPGYGNGTSLPIVSGNQASLTQSVTINGLGRGVHRVSVRARNAQGQWSTTQTQTFVIYSLVATIPPHGSPSNIIKAEYFVDTDPGHGNGVDIPLTAGSHVTVQNIAVNISSLALGVHHVFLRTKSADGAWSASANAKFTLIVNNLGQLPAHPAAKAITSLEYFFDTDPGVGNGTRLTVPATTDLSGYNFAADITSLAVGSHTLFVRTLNGLSTTQAITFNIGMRDPLPVTWLSFQAQQLRNSVLLKWSTVAERNNSHYLMERSTDGRNFKTIGKVDVQTDATVHHYEQEDSSPMNGTNYYRLKQVDENGAYTYSVVVSVEMSGIGSGITINNPVQHALVVRRSGEVRDLLPVTILNASGVVMMQPVLTSNAQTIDVSQLVPGFYFFNWNEQGEARTIRFLKQ